MMDRTTFSPNMAMTYPFAAGHRAGKEGKPFVVRPMGGDSRLSPAGGIYSNATDLGRFAIAFLNEGRIDGRQALSSHVIKQMSTIRADIAPERQKYGYGLFIYDHRGVRTLEHVGTMPGFFGLLRMVPEERVAVILLSNQEQGNLTRIVEKAMELMISLSSDSQPALGKSEQMTDAEKQSYVGD
jgi:CubicO group peptidase (beta-lactamase class C family)